MENWTHIRRQEIRAAYEDGTSHCIIVSCTCSYSMVFVFYTLCLLVMLIIRPALSSKLMPNRGKSAIYSALYFLPALIVVHAIAAGLICE